MERSSARKMCGNPSKRGVGMANNAGQREGGLDLGIIAGTRENLVHGVELSVFNLAKPGYVCVHAKEKVASYETACCALCARDAL